MWSKITIASVATLGMLFATTSAQAGPNVSFNFGPNGPRIVIGGPGRPNHHQVRPLPVPPPNNHHFHVEYRQFNWQEQSFATPYEAERFADFKRSQGFEVIATRHTNHFDVQYRMLNWRVYRSVGSDAYAHSLERSLEQQGFQARVVHH